jgi:hypothetical protein
MLSSAIRLLVPTAWQAELQENVQMRLLQGEQQFVSHLDEGAGVMCFTGGRVSESTGAEMLSPS